MNEPFRQAFETFEKSGRDFHAALAHCLAYGEVQSNARYFCMGWPTGAGGFFVQMLAGDFRECARCNADRFRTLHFVREFKGSPRLRTLNLKRIARHGISRHTAAA